MKRDKRTVYLLPDISRRVDDIAAKGGLSPNAIIETALDEHFARESTYSAVEALTRRFGEVEERMANQQATLAEMGRSINLIGRAVTDLKSMLRPPPPAEPAGLPSAETRDREPEPEHADRSGWFGLGRR